MISILTPAFNEADNLLPLYDRLAQALTGAGEEWEWLVADDHSDDGTFHVVAALAEVRRVLRPMGRLLFLEQGRAQGRRMAHWQDRLDPIWSGLTGGCHINRNISRMIENAGFRIEYLDTFRLSSLPGVLGLHYVGIARLR